MRAKTCRDILEFFGCPLEDQARGPEPIQPSSAKRSGPSAPQPVPIEPPPALGREETANLAGDQTTGEFAVGSHVLVDIEGVGLWESARVSERTGDLLLVTTFTGEQLAVAPSRLHTPEVIPGAAVMFLYGVGYRWSMAHEVKDGMVGIEWPREEKSIEEKLEWVDSSTVFLDQIDVGAPLVRRARGKVVEAGRIVQRSPLRGFRIQRDDGYEGSWIFDKQGEELAVAAHAVSPQAPLKGSDVFDKFDYVKPTVILGLLLTAMMILLMVIGGGWLVQLIGLAICIGVTCATGELLLRNVPRSVRTEAAAEIILGTFVIICLASLVLEPGIYKVVVPFFYGWTLIGIMGGLLGNRPSKYEPKKKNMDDDALNEKYLGSTRAYRKGERLFFIPPGEAFMRIGRAVSLTGDVVEVAAPGGERHVLGRQSVLPYAIEVDQRVLAWRREQEAFRPAVVVHIEDRTFTVRFDDWTADTCQMDGLRFIYRKEFFELSPGEGEAMLTVQEQTLAEARAACEQNQTRRALQIIQAALQRYPWNPALCLGAAFVFQAEGQHEKTIEMAKKAIGVLTSDQAPYTVLGNACLSLGRLGEAEEAFRAALNVNPEEAGHWVNLGNLHKRLGRQKESDYCYAQARFRNAPI